MAKMSRRRRVLATLTISAPIASVLLLVGAAAPASAVTYFSSCPASGYACFYGNSNFTPWNGSNDLIGLQGTNGDWGAFGDISADGSCSGESTTWNDCASSDRNRLSNDMWVWRDVSCQGAWFVLPSGVDYSDWSTKSFSPSGNVNDNVSSDRMSAGTGC